MRDSETKIDKEMDTEKEGIFKGKHPYERRREKKREHKALPYIRSSLTPTEYQNLTDMHIIAHRTFLSLEAQRPDVTSANDCNWRKILLRYCDSIKSVN